MNSTYHFTGGELKEKANALERGMLYGDGFFESMRWHNGKILLRQLHEERLRRSAELLQMNLQELADLQILEKKLSASIQEKNLRIRIVVTRSGTGFYLPDANNTTVYVQLQSLNHYYQLNERGLRCINYKAQTKAAGKFSCIKSTSALLYVMASLEMKSSGADEAIIYNSEGRIAEGSSTNLFLCSGKKILTPSLEEGCVDGVFRKFLLHTASKNGYSVTEGKVTEEDLKSADELWFTSSIRGLIWAESCEEKNFENTEARHLHSLLLKELL
jgi:branched-chain amino acid aminotransferase